MVLRDYSALGGFFYKHRWEPFMVSYNQQDTRVESTQKSSLIEMLSHNLGISAKEFEKTYLEPLKAFSESDITFWARAVSDYSHLNLVRPFRLALNEDVRAHEWFLLYFSRLNLPGFINGFNACIRGNDTGLRLPYRQCYYCGEKDKDERGVAFIRNRKLCHSIDCRDATSDDLFDHAEDCCSKQWQQLRKRAGIRFERALNTDDLSHLEDVLLETVEEITLPIENVKYAIRDQRQFLEKGG